MKKKQPLSSCCGKQNLDWNEDGYLACTNCGAEKTGDDDITSEKKQEINEESKEQPEWEEALNKILWSNLALKEEHARPMKRELQDDLKAFIRKIEQEAYERGRDDGYDKGFDKGVEYSEEIKKQERAEFKKELMGKLPKRKGANEWTIKVGYNQCREDFIKIIKEA